MGKRTIIISSFRTPDSTGGFFWAPDTSVGRETMEADFAMNVAYGYANSVVVQLDVVEHWDQQTVTDYIDKVLLDLIETRQIGKILLAHDRWGEHPYQRLIRETGGQSS